MTKETKQKEEVREAKPKYRSVIPADFKIRRSPSPMNDILREAENVSTEPPTEIINSEIVTSPEIISNLELISSQEIKHPIAQKIASQEMISSPEIISPPSNNLAAFAESLNYGKGHLRLNHDYFDKVMTLLNENEQLLFIHILRYREKQNNYTIRLNWPLLERRTHITGRTLGKVAKSLENKGVAHRFDYRFGKGIDQGFRFRIVLPSSLVTASSPETISSLETISDSNRREVLKENTKRGGASPDFKNCPDCLGTNFWYPNGTENGVAKCLHPKLP